MGTHSRSRLAPAVEPRDLVGTAMRKVESRISTDVSELERVNVNPADFEDEIFAQLDKQLAAKIKEEHLIRVRGILHSWEIVDLGGGWIRREYRARTFAEEI